MKEKQIQKLIKKVPYYFLRISEIVSRSLANKTSILYFDKLYCSAKYQRLLQKKLDLKHPKSFNEKIQWLKLYDRKPLYTQLADKYTVRGFVEERIGDQHLNELIGVYSSVDEIVFDQLPDRFVLKATHGCGWNIICEDKKALDIIKVKRQLNHWLQMNFYKNKGEWNYKNITPRIICEDYLEGDKYFGLIDYKFYCFNGTPNYVQVNINKHKKQKMIFYDCEWVKQPFTKKPYLLLAVDVPRPSNLETMIDCARALSSGLAYCRVDFYSQINSVIFGEITFFPASGFTDFKPDKYNNHLGALINLPEIVYQN